MFTIGTTYTNHLVLNPEYRIILNVFSLIVIAFILLNGILGSLARLSYGIEGIELRNHIVTFIGILITIGFVFLAYYVTTKLVKAIKDYHSVGEK